MPWQKVILSRDDIVSGNLTTLMHAFAEVHLAAGSPEEAVMFDDNEGGGICYFSPKAVEIAKTLIARSGGKDCPAPRASEVGVLSGSQSHAGVPFAPELPEPDDN